MSIPPMFRALHGHLAAGGGCGPSPLRSVVPLVTVQRPPTGTFPVAEGGHPSGFIFVGGGAGIFCASQLPAARRALAAVGAAGHPGMVSLLPPPQRRTMGTVVLPAAGGRVMMPVGPDAYLLLQAVYDGLRSSREEIMRWYRLACCICGLAVGVGCCGVVIEDRQAYLQTMEAARAQLVRADLAASDAALALSGEPLVSRLVRKNSRRTVEQAYALALEQPLGEGAFGLVYRGVHQGTGVPRALKRIDKAVVPDLEMLRLEVEAQARMDHPHVCRLIEIFDTDRHVWLVTELCRGGELGDRLERAASGLPEAEVAPLMSQMLRATLHCHSREFVHRDLKPENFLFADGPAAAVAEGLHRGALARRPRPGDEHLKLIDFGLATPAAPSQARRGGPKPPTGTLLYSSPQALSGQQATASDDLWSIGVIFHVLLTGRFPFSTNDDDKFLEIVRNGQLRDDVQGHLDALQLPPDAADLLRRLLAYEPEDRITAAEAVRHPFVAAALAAEPGLQEVDLEEIRRRLHRFSASCRLRRFVATALARLSDGRLLSEACPWALRAFEQLDRRGDGLVRPAELAAFLRGREPGAGAAAAAAAAAGPQAEGMTYSTFLAAVLDGGAAGGGPAAAGERLLQTVFELLDADRDEAITAADLEKRFGVSPAESRRLISEALAEIGAVAPATVARWAGAVECQSVMGPAKEHLSFGDFARLMGCSAPPP